MKEKIISIVLAIATVGFVIYGLYLQSTPQAISAKMIRTQTDYIIQLSQELALRDIEIDSLKLDLKEIKEKKK